MNAEGRASRGCGQSGGVGRSSRRGAQAAEARAAAAAAAALAEAARRDQEEAVVAEQPESESERRAKVFNNAAAQAVQRFQGQLESERDELSGRCAKLVMS